MEEPASATELLFERIEAYGKTTIELTKLKALKTLSNIVMNACHFGVASGSAIS